MTRRDADVKASGALIVLTTLVLMPVLWIGLINDPVSTLAEFADIYVMFLFLPIAIGVALIVVGTWRDRNRRKD